MKAVRVIQIAILAVNILFFIGISISSSQVDRSQLSTECFDLYIAGNSLYNNGYYQDSINKFTEYLNGCAPNDHETFFNRGWTYQKLGDYSSAFHDYNRAAELSQGVEKASYLQHSGSLMLTMMNNGYQPKTENSYSQAITILQQATQLDPNNSYAWNSLGNAYWGLADILPGNPSHQLQLYKQASSAYGNSQLPEAIANKNNVDEYVRQLNP
ncbi:MAG: tetratricopeptide repeat protein [Methanotrichaceae archaeon]|nr:tetratricopeptide repeat protein [Methanotrichaceae archaeon]